MHINPHALLSTLRLPGRFWENIIMWDTRDVPGIQQNAFCPNICNKQNIHTDSVMSLLLFNDEVVSTCICMSACVNRHLHVFCENMVT